MFSRGLGTLSLLFGNFSKELEAQRRRDEEREKRMTTAISS
jgi:hypothetical protein